MFMRKKLTMPVTEYYISTEKKYCKHYFKNIEYRNSYLLSFAYLGHPVRLKLTSNGILI